MKKHNRRLEDLERDRTRTIQDLNQKLRDDIYDARLRAHRRIEDLNENTGLDEAERAERIAKVEEELTRRIEDLTRDRNRRIADLGLEQRRQRVDLARQASAKEVEIAERTAGTTIRDRGAANGGTDTSRIRDRGCRICGGCSVPGGTGRTMFRH